MWVCNKVGLLGILYLASEYVSLFLCSLARESNVMRDVNRGSVVIIDSETHGYIVEGTRTDFVDEKLVIRRGRKLEHEHEIAIFIVELLHNLSDLARMTSKVLLTSVIELTVIARHCESDEVHIAKRFVRHLGDAVLNVRRVINTSRERSA